MRTSYTWFSRLSPMLGAALLAAPRLALAQATCTLNGKEVPCEQVKGFLGWGVGILALFAILAIAGTIFWIMMVIHAASNPIENKAMWIIVMVLTGVLGAVIYYFVVKRKFPKKAPAPARKG